MERMEGTDILALPLPLAWVGPDGEILQYNEWFDSVFADSTRKQALSRLNSIAPSINDDAWRRLWSGTSETVCLTAEGGPARFNAALFAARCSSDDTRALLLAGHIGEIDSSDHRARNESVTEVDVCRLVARCTSSATYVIDLEAEAFLDVNAAACVLSGTSRRHLLRSSVTDHLELRCGDVAAALRADNPRDSATLAGSRSDAIRFVGTTARVDAMPWMFLSSGRPILVLVAGLSAGSAMVPQRLAKNDNFVQQMADAIDEIFYVFDVDARVIVYVSPAFERVFGRPTPHRGASTMDWAFAIHPSDRDRVIRSRQNHSARQGLEETYRVLRPDGTIRWLRDRYFPLTLDNGSHRRVAGVAQDITELLEARETLRLSEDKFASVFRANPDAITIGLLASGRLTDVSAGFERISGFTREDAIGRTLTEVGVWSDRREAELVAGELARTGRCNSIGVTWRRKDGKALSCLMSAEVVDIDGLDHVVAVTKDITARRRLEYTLRALAQLPGPSDRQSLCDALCLELTKAIDARWVTILGYDKGSGRCDEILASCFGDTALESGAGLGSKLIDEVVSSESVVIAEGAWRSYTDSTYMAKHHPEGLVGVSVQGGGGEVVGIILALRDRKLEQPQLVAETASVFALRLGLELDRLKAVEELNQSQAHLLLAQDAAEMGLWSWDFKTNVVTCSERTLEILRLPPQERHQTLAGMLRLSHPEDRLAVERTARNVIRDNTASDRYQKEHHVVHADGQESWVAVFGKVQRDSEGRPYAMSGLVLDVTERRTFEKRLVEREAELRTILSATPTGIGMEADGHFKWVNGRLCDMVGRSREELLGKSTRVVYPSDAEFDRVSKLKHRQMSQRGIGPVETTLQHRDGTLVRVLLSSMPVNPGDLAKGVIFSALDISELRRAEKTALHSRERFQAIFECANAGMVLVDKEGRILQANRAYARMIGYRLEEILGLTVQELTVPEDVSETESLLEHLGRGEDYGRVYEKRYIRKDRTVFTASVNVSTVRAANGEIEGALGVVIDISQQKESQQALQMAMEEMEVLKDHLEAENVYLREEVSEGQGADTIIGDDPAMLEVLTKVHQVARTNASVLITGETGVGKELVARVIHEQSKRRKAPMIRVNCASIPRELFESEFFGHVRGSFTGAVSNRTGRFELADGGTLFLDEVGEIPLEQQGKLLRVLQEGEFERIGEESSRMVDVRVIAATNRDIEKEVKEGRFREDLYYRLSVFPIEVPPLRRRLDDVPALAERFLAQACRRIGVESMELTESHIRDLQGYAWPGNVRELQNVIERAVISSVDGALTFSIPTTTADAQGGSRPVRSLHLRHRGQVVRDEHIREIEIENIRTALKTAGGRVAGRGGAAELLDINPSTLYSRIKALGIKRSTGTQTADG